MEVEGHRAPDTCARGSAFPEAASRCRSSGVPGAAMQRRAPALGAAVAVPTRRGRAGAAPTERNSEGGWVGQSRAQRVLLRDGGVGGAAPPTDNTRSASGPRLRCQPAGGVGAQPPQNETPRAGGRARAARSACWSGMGAWGAQPPIDNTLSASEPRGRCRPGGGVGAQPPQKETPRAGGRARAARSALSRRYGATMTRASAARWAAPRSGAGIRPKKSTARAARPSSAWTGVLAWNGVSSSGSSSTIVRSQRR